jgi:hypothetical protein
MVLTALVWFWFIRILLIVSNGQNIKSKSKNGSPPTFPGFANYRVEKIRPVLCGKQSQMPVWSPALVIPGRIAPSILQSLHRLRAIHANDRIN